MLIDLEQPHKDHQVLEQMCKKVLNFNDIAGSEKKKGRLRSASPG